MKIPDKAAFVLRQLEAAGFEAYVVGGCVRDALLGKEPKDWDITTSARPDQVRALFGQLRKGLPRTGGTGYRPAKLFTVDTSGAGYQPAKVFTVDTGAKHGTITVMLDGEGFEVTTFRLDGAYSDGRHPDEVTFTPALKKT